jgi:phosphatidylglycerophosphate synthase
VARRPVAGPPASRRPGFRRLVGLDRSGPPPPETLSGAPLRPWTVPNAVGFARAALIPVFLAVGLSGDGRGAAAAILFAVVAWGDYVDGIAARVTGQYSRLGALLDPVVDRLLVIAGVVVCWRHDLLPRWALGVLVAREVAVVVLARIGMRRGLELRINWPGRLAVWPLMSAIFFALAGAGGLAEGLLYAGLALALAATALYVRDGLRNVAPGPSTKD